ncbi:MAG TPA: histidine phosphatase family protein [Opitutaceae bacterium]|nr:histidine phosphatase family protein [Opitutaceae bacterium]
MELYLIRHAHATAAGEDSLRPLSDRGREECARLVAFFQRNGALRPAQLWHSPLVRALETARLLADGLKLDHALVETPGLLPEDDPAQIADRIGKSDTIDRLAIVGHEPHLSALATLLVRGKDHPAAFDLKKGAVLAFAPAGGTHKKTGRPRWHLLWHIEPGLLGPPAKTNLAPR